MKISCIMANYNTPRDYLVKAIDSIVCQTHRELELIVVDDCSTDNSCAVIEEFVQRDNRIILIKNDSNMGLARSLNVALEKASSDYIARMDTDDVSDPERFEIQLKFLLDNDLDIVGSETRRIDECGEVVVTRTNKSYSTRYISKVLRYENCIAHPSWLVKRNVYKELSGYRYFRACEDYDFLLRAVKRGYRIGICDSVLLSYRINTKGISQSNLLPQKVSSWYLASNLKRIEEIDQNEINTKVLAKLTPKANENFSLALMEYNRAIEMRRRGSIKTISYLFRACRKSRYMFKVFSCAFHVWICRLRYGR